MTEPSRDDLRTLTIRSAFAAQAFADAYHAALAGDDALATKRFNAGMAELRGLAQMAGSGTAREGWDAHSGE